MNISDAAASYVFDDKHIGKHTILNHLTFNGRKVIVKLIIGGVRTLVTKTGKEGGPLATTPQKEGQVVLSPDYFVNLGDRRPEIGEFLLCKDNLDDPTTHKGLEEAICEGLLLVLKYLFTVGKDVDDDTIHDITILVTCNEGRNRASAMMLGLLMMLDPNCSTPKTAREALLAMQHQRIPALKRFNSEPFRVGGNSKDVVDQIVLRTRDPNVPHLAATIAIEFAGHHGNSQTWFQCGGHGCLAIENETIADAGMPVCRRCADHNHDHDHVHHDHDHKRSSPDDGPDDGPDDSDNDSERDSERGGKRFKMEENA
jgi:hypothetical protein